MDVYDGYIYSGVYKPTSDLWEPMGAPPCIALSLGVAVIAA